MPEFTTDWSGSITHWPAMFDELGLTGRPGLRFLEIGCFEGRTTLWLLEHVLTDPTSRIVVIDPFDEIADQFERFAANVCSYLRSLPYGTGQRHSLKVKIKRGTSSDHLARMLGSARRSRWAQPHSYDFIYIDGDHCAHQVLEDAVLSWPLLRPGGTMVFDDYVGLDQPQEWQRPQIAVDAFVACYRPQIGEAGRCGADQYLIRKGV